MNKPYIHGMLPDLAEPTAAAKAEATAIRFLGDMQRLQPQAGDVFVLTCEESLDQATAGCIKDHLSGVLGGAKVLVLDRGMKLGVVAEPVRAASNMVVNVVPVGELYAGLGKLNVLPPQPPAATRRNL